MKATIIDWSYWFTELVLALAYSVGPLLLIAAFILWWSPRNRGWGGALLMWFSLFLGAGTWTYGVAVTLVSFGWIGFIVGFMFMGIGVVPIGIVGAFWHAEWYIGFTLIGLLVATFGARALGVLMIRNAEEYELIFDLGWHGADSLSIPYYRI